MVAAQKLSGDANAPVYGIVTDGEAWQFGQLVDHTFTKHRTRLTIDDLARLFGEIAYLLR